MQGNEVGGNVPTLAGISSGLQHAGDGFVVLLDTVSQLQAVVRKSTDHRHELSDVGGNGVNTLNELVLVSNHHLDGLDGLLRGAGQFVDFILELG